MTLLVNRYCILRELGSGGFGKTFLAEDTHMPSNRRCAIKQLQPQTASSDEVHAEIARRFAREAAVLEELGDGNSQIPTLYAYFEAEEQFYLVQEYVEGDTLAARVARNGPLSDSGIRALLASLLPVLDYVHARRIVHRDIKPGNILLDASDRPTLIDFGAVREVMGTAFTSSGHSAASMVIGTSGFMPPEQAAGRPVFASDLYALAMTAVYALTGKLPQELATDPATGALVWRPAAPRVSPQLANVLDRAIQPHARDRHASAREMLADLQGQAATATPPPLPTELSAPASTRPTPHTTFDPTPPPVPATYAPPAAGNPWKTAAIACLILFALAGTAGATYYFVQREPEPDPVATTGGDETGDETGTNGASNSPDGGGEPFASDAPISEAERIERERAQLAAEREQIEQQRLASEREQLERERAALEAARQQEAQRQAAQQARASLPFRPACGSPPGSGTVWYPVVGNSSALSTVKGRFCGDAYINASGRTQAASFTSRSQARAFAQRLSSASGHSFWVGDP